MKVDKYLKILVKLQTIDSKIDEIEKVRGDLPEEVQDLEDELAGLETRITKFETEHEGLENEITERKEAIKTANDLVAKYTEQQNTVRNNREYDAITKEIELQELEAQVCEKKIKEAGYGLEKKKEEIEKVKEGLESRTADLATKKVELETIIAESKEEEDKLLVDREKITGKIEDRLLLSYDKLRGKVRNRLAVVSVKRNACGGCFNTVPPQRQSDVKDKKKIMVCEHCGRILADVEVVKEVVKPKKKRTVRAKKATS